MRTDSMNRTVLALFAAVGAIATATVVAAPATIDEVPQIAVDYSDLNLNTEEGIRVLHRRLVGAADRVCPRTDGRVKLEVKAAARECRKQALEQAVRDIGSPELAALHAATTTRG